MKIAILTQPLLHNYGGIVQNFALQTILKQKGYNVTTIDWGWNKPFGWRYWINYIKNVLSFRKTCLLSGEEKDIIYGEFDRFIDKYIERTPKKYNPKDFLKIKNNEYDAFVVGSDQCWRPKYNGRFLSSMFLSFLSEENKKRIAYAVSFGTDEWEFSNKQTKECSELAKKFDLITVRESSGISLCQNKLGITAYHVLDPTMLLSCDFYKQLITNENPPNSSGSLFCYILDPTDSKSEYIKKVADITGFKPFSILPQYREASLNHNIIRNNIDKCRYPSVISWLKAFCDAKMTIVDSFHGVVFSIIFNKPFWVIGNEHRGLSRFISLLDMFDLSERLIDDNMSYSNVNFSQKIDWNNVNQKLDKYKNISINLILSNLK